MHTQDNQERYGVESHTQGARLEERAIKQRWPISDEVKMGILTRQARIALDPESSPRAASVAAKTIAAFERQNQLDEHHGEGDTLKVEHDIDIAAIANQITTEEDYIEYLRAKACESDTDAGAVRQVGLIADSGTVGNGQPHGGAGQGTNGDRNGSE